MEHGAATATTATTESDKVLTALPNAATGTHSAFSTVEEKRARGP